MSTTHRSPATVNGEPPFELWSLGEAASFVVAEATTAHVSGRYSGTKQQAGPLPLLTPRLDLRIDIDRRAITSPVTNRISGDFYRTVFSPVQPGQPPSIGQVYQESWIVDDPQVVWLRDSATITGTVRFWKGTHPATSIQIVIPSQGDGTPDEAVVTFTEAGGTRTTYLCAKQSDCFRDLTLEVDIVQSVDAGPTLVSYDTHAHPNRPANLLRRVLMVEEAYREAGVCLTIRPERTVIDDSAPGFATWSAAELHDAMETHFSRFSGAWPNWEMWGLLAGTYDRTSVGGIMFDARASAGGAGEAPERQGFAVFRNHSWFADLPTGAPTNQAQAEAVRKLLYTWVHEAGHAFNFLHSWDKNRPDALSWMNYDWRYDDRNGADAFWANFRFEFDPEELIHLRHGDRAAVIPGGDPWGSGGHLEAPPAAFTQMEGEAPLELLLRSQGYFAFMEPVAIELRVRNLLPGASVGIDPRLDPEFGTVAVFIRRPDGRILKYQPICCKLATAEIRSLAPSTTSTTGEDRHSEQVFLSYGRDGFYFDQPGEYHVRALYQGTGDMLIPSNVLRIRVGVPLSQEEDRLAQEFFSDQVGLTLYHDGSQSPFLEHGREVVSTLIEQSQDTLRGAKLSTTLATGVAEPFFRVQYEDANHGALTQTHEADPEQALALTETAVTVYQQAEGDTARPQNLPYHQLVRNRAAALAKLGQEDAAQQAVADLHDDLEARGVNESVLSDVQAYAESFTGKGGARRRRRR